MPWNRLLTGLALAIALLPAQLRAGEMILIEGARVFDGTGAKAKVADVMVDGTRIVAVGKALEAPADVARVDGRGKTLIPGLHDLHTHVRSPAYDAPEDLPKAWAGYLLAGVTTLNDYSVSGEMIAPIRELTADPGNGGFWAPHLNEAIRFGVPGGHGTEYGWGSFFTLQTATARAAHAFMPRALGYDPDVIKVFSDGWRYDRDPNINSMNVETLTAIVKDAHAAGKPVVTHTVTLEASKIAAISGVDALGHGIGDALIDDELVELMQKSGTSYIATLVVYEPQQARVMNPGELSLLDAGEAADEKRRFGGKILAYDAERWRIMRANIGRLKKAKIRIAIGTDAGIGGVYHGSSALREIWWMAQLGLTDAEALVAATRGSALAMDKNSWTGLIAPGMIADLVLVDGEPDRRIEDMAKVARVWVSGREVPLDKMRTLRANPDATPLPSVAMTGPVLSEARADGRTDLGTLPVATTEPGIDHSHMVVLDKDAGDPTFLAAQMGAAPRPYVQWVLPLTPGPIKLADARAFDGIELVVKGTGDYRLVIESYGLDGSEWLAAPFKPGKERATIRLPFEEFRSRRSNVALDLAKLRALRIQLSGKTGGTASLEVAAIRFYKG